DDDGFEFLAEQAALLVLLIDEEQHRILQRRLGDGHGARERVENADLDGVLSARGRDCSRGRDGKARGGGKPLAGGRPPGGRYGCLVHASRSPAFDARVIATLRAATRSQAPCQAVRNGLRHWTKGDKVSKSLAA